MVADNFKNGCILCKHIDLLLDIGNRSLEILFSEYLQSTLWNDTLLKVLFLLKGFWNRLVNKQKLKLNVVELYSVA